MNLLFTSIFLIYWHTAFAEEPIVLLKASADNPSDLNDVQASAESSKEKTVTPSTKQLHADNIDAYTSGLTPQFRTLLLAPESTESQILRKPTKNPKKEHVQHETDERPEVTYQTYKNEFEGIPQAHLDQLLRYYGKIAGKLLPQGYAKFRKIATEGEKAATEKQDEPEVKETTQLVEAPSNPDPKPSPSTEHVVSTAVNTAIVNAALAALQASQSIPGYGGLNYLNAASYGPPRAQNAYIAAALRNQISSYLPTQSSYGVPNCCNICPPCNTQSSVYENNCGGSTLQGNNMAMNNGMGCAGTDYNTADTENDEYGPDSYYPGGGYGSNVQASHETANNAGSNRHSQLLSAYASQSSSTPTLYGSNKQPSNYYQVSSPISNPYLIDAHPYSPVGSLFATSHMHHFGSYPSNPFQQYYGTLNAYPNSQRFGYGTTMSDSELGNQNMFGYSNNPFGPMFDYAASANNEAETTTTAQISKTTPKEVAKQKGAKDKSAEHHDQKPIPIESIFHIVKPNFASLKKAALMQKHRLLAKTTRKSEVNSTTPATTTNGQQTSTTPSKSVLIARKMAKILIAKKSSTPAPRTTTVKRRDKTENRTTSASTTKISATKLVSTTTTEPKDVTRKGPVS